LKKITVIPLDSRPCNTSWLEKLVNTEVELVVYPKELCGNLINGASIDSMINFLDHHIMTTDYLIISADGLCSGGLVQARLGNIDLNEVLEKISILNKYKQKNKNLQIYLFDTIMRTSITAYDEESEFYWSKMNEYSKLLGLVYFLNKEEDKEKLQELKNSIPKKIIETYHRAREVKHNLNKHFIELASKKIIDYMILLQEDSMPNGVQKIEQIKLLDLINEYNIADKVKFYNGTDEGAVVLIGKILLEEIDKKPKVYIHLPNPLAINKVMPFEDLLLSENIINMFDTIGLIKTENYREADFILSIYLETNDYNLSINTTEEIKPKKNKEYLQYIKELNEFIAQNKRVAFVDLLFPNGGSIDLLKDINFLGLSVYSAWNTASNCLGSCLCEIASIYSNPTSTTKKFMIERLLDDCIYQYIVRRIINSKYISKGYNIHNLGDNTQIVLDDIKSEMEKYSPLIGEFKYNIILPWNRTFEIDIEVEDNL